MTTKKILGGIVAGILAITGIIPLLPYLATFFANLIILTTIDLKHDINELDTLVGEMSEVRSLQEISLEESTHDYWTLQALIKGRSPADSVVVKDLSGDYVLMSVDDYAHYLRNMSSGVDH